MVSFESNKPNYTRLQRAPETNLRSPCLDLPQMRVPRRGLAPQQMWVPHPRHVFVFVARVGAMPAQTTSASPAREQPSSASACSRPLLRPADPSEQPPCEQPASASSVPVRLQSSLCLPFLFSFLVVGISLPWGAFTAKVMEIATSSPVARIFRSVSSPQT